MTYSWLVENCTKDGKSTGLYMACQVNMTVTADVNAARKFRRQITAEFRALDMREARRGDWRAVEHGFDDSEPPNGPDERAAQPVAGAVTPTADEVRLAAFELCEFIEEIKDKPTDSQEVERFKAGQRYAAKSIRKGLGIWFVDEENSRKTAQAAPAPEPSAQGEPVAFDRMEVRAIVQQAYLALEELQGPGFLIGGVMHYRIGLILPKLNEAINALASAPSTQPHAVVEAVADERFYSAPSAQGEPVAWLRQDWSGSGPSSLSFDGPPDPKPVRDEVVNPVWTPLYASAPSTQPHAVVEAVPLTEAARDVLAERHRQIQAEGWTPAHDDEHDSGELAGAGAAYALHAADALHPQSQGDAYRDGSIPHGWCWEDCWWKPTDPRRSLVKAGALILAELERMDRGIAPKAAQEKT